MSKQLLIGLTASRHRRSWRMGAGVYISERSSSTKLKLNESTKRNAWLTLRDTIPWQQPTVRSVMLFGVVDIFAFMHTSPLYF